MRPKALRTCGKTRMRSPKSALPRRFCSGSDSPVSHRAEMPGPATLLCSFAWSFEYRMLRFLKAACAAYGHCRVCVSRQARRVQYQQVCIVLSRFQWSTCDVNDKKTVEEVRRRQHAAARL